MSNARNLADIVTGNFDVPLGALDNVPPSNDASALTTGTLPVGRLPSSGITASSLTTGSLGTARLPAGSVLQVVSVLKTDTASAVSQSYVDITGLSVVITPTSASSKFLVIPTLNLNINGHGSIRLVRDGVPIASGDSGNGSQTRATFQVQGDSAWTHENVALTVLDTPNTTASITYKMQWATPWSLTYTCYLNRGVSDDTNNYSGRTVSSLTVMEIAG